MGEVIENIIAGTYKNMVYSEDWMEIINGTDPYIRLVIFLCDMRIDTSS